MAKEVSPIPPAEKLFGLLSENEKLATSLITANRELVFENETLTADLITANNKLVEENGNLTTELIIANKELVSQLEAYGKREAALIVSDKEILTQQVEKKEWAAELAFANEELLYQQGEKQHRAEELVIANEELLFQQGEKQHRAEELVIANEELLYQQGEKQHRAEELVIANKELGFQQGEKRKRIDELARVNRELVIESENGKRSAELMVANNKLAFQNSELEKRANDLISSNRARLELLAQLLQSQKLESLGTLAGGIAHDMNNVLGAILGLATAHMQIQAADSSAYRAFETISKAAVRGGKMAKGLLNFARQSPAEELELDLNVILREEVRLLERTTLAKVYLELELATDLRPMRGDASALTHAFMNLCVNAVDAMPDSGTLTLRTHNIDNDWIEVEVEDNGCGMPKEVLGRALDPFFTTKAEGKGTGLGLSLVHSTVKAHRGSMDIFSEPGRGTCVKMRFPATEPEIQHHVLEAASGAVHSQIGLKVLLVDDDELIQSSSQTILEWLGHTVTGAFSGEEGLEKLAAGCAPDLVILDINMPGLGGARTLRCLRGLYPDLPVLLATGRVDQTALNLVATYPHVTLLPKPFTLKELQKHLPLGQA
jgi:signal transduction histidine kinase